MAEKKTPFGVKFPKLEAMEAELATLKELRKIKADQWKSMKDGFGEINTFIDKGGIEEALTKPIERATSRIEKQLEGALAPITTAFDTMLQDVLTLFDPVFEAISIGATAYTEYIDTSYTEIGKRMKYWWEEWVESLSRRAAVQEFEMLQLTEEYKKVYEDYMWEVRAKERGTRGHLEW